MRSISSLVIAMLAGVGLSASAQAQGANPPGVNPTHYQCYRVEAPTKPVELKQLRDQFGIAGPVKVATPMFLCAPTAKNGVAPRDRITHYLCYQDEGVKPANRKARITNQFGTLDLAVLGPTTLCVPSLKRLL
jgi:hypothetical protein